MTRAVTLQFTDEIAQAPVVDHQHVAGPGVSLGVGTLHGAGVVTAETQLLTRRHPQRRKMVVGGAHLDGVLLHTHQSARRFAAHREARAQGTDAALRGVHDKRSRQCVPCRFNVNLATEQAHFAQAVAVANVHGAGRIELQLAAVIEADAATLASAGTLIGHQGRQWCGVPGQGTRPARRQQNRQHLEHVTPLGPGARQGRAHDARSDLAKLVLQTCQALPGLGVAGITFQPASMRLAGSVVRHLATQVDVPTGGGFERGVIQDLGTGHGSVLDQQQAECQRAHRMLLHRVD
ncbi:hypothetical protein D3C73_785740 [compost metagenome]